MEKKTAEEKTLKKLEQDASAKAFHMKKELDKAVARERRPRPSSALRIASDPSVIQSCNHRKYLCHL